MGVEGMKAALRDEVSEAGLAERADEIVAIAEPRVSFIVRTASERDIPLG